MVIRAPFVYRTNDGDGGRNVIVYTLGYSTTALPESRDALQALTQELVEGETQQVSRPYPSDNTLFFIAFVWVDRDNDNDPCVTLFQHNACVDEQNLFVSQRCLNNTGHIEEWDGYTRSDEHIILGLEELQRRTSDSFDEYINGPRPALPDFLVAH